MKSFVTSICLCFIGIGSLLSQELKGIIYNSAGNPISEAFIHTPDSKLHTHSDLRGKFYFSGLTPGDTILIAYLGYRTIEIVLDEASFQQEQYYFLEEKFFELDQVNITNSLKTTSQVASIDLQTAPVRSSQEVLSRVPGLFIAQHAGGGKAEQIFLRGFDIDHGTDIAIEVDGLPVNMVSHAHGQGYADLHFLIPETIENIDFGKGPYYADKGNFNTAGYVEFKTKDYLDNSTFGLEYGAFNSSRIYGLFDLLGERQGQSAYLATEYIQSDGPFESPQNFRRLNLMGKYVHDFKSNDRLSILFSHFDSKWNASGQIPQRLVDNGTISRFGAVDDTEGGNTSRTNFAVDHTKVLGDNRFLKTKAFYSRYGFELFSNFTFFLEDPVNGDQIQQFESRNLYGLQSTLFFSSDRGDFHMENRLGVGFRYDEVNENQLSYTINRSSINNRLAYGDVDEINYFGFYDTQLEWDEWVLNLGARLDIFDFSYVDRLSTIYNNKSSTAARISPKANLIYNPNPQLQLFLKSGLGYHSNDTRVVVAQDGKKILPAALGIDLGAAYKPMSRMWINAALWYLYLQQEFVYVGDAAIVEPSGETRRQGIEVGLRYQLSNSLFLNSDFSYTIARSINDPEGNNFIPLAPDLLWTGNITYRNNSGFSGGISYRYIKDRPANEDNSIVALGYFVSDMNLNYKIKDVSIGLRLENIFDTDWNESQFATESRLFNEATAAEELHFTPGNPRNLRASIQYNF